MIKFTLVVALYSFDTDRGLEGGQNLGQTSSWGENQRKERDQSSSRRGEGRSVANH